MPGKRGPSEKRPVGDISELPMKDMALELHIPKTQLGREYEQGLYDGAYILRGEIPWFVVHLMKEIQRKRALQSSRRRKTA